MLSYRLRSQSSRSPEQHRRFNHSRILQRPRILGTPRTPGSPNSLRAPRIPRSWGSLISQRAPEAPGLGTPSFPGASENTSGTGDKEDFGTLSSPRVPGASRNSWVPGTFSGLWALSSLKFQNLLQVKKLQKHPMAQEAYKALEVKKAQELPDTRDVPVAQKAQNSEHQDLPSSRSPRRYQETTMHLEPLSFQLSRSYWNLECSMSPWIL